MVPFMVGVCEYGSDVLFVHQGNSSMGWSNGVLVSARRTMRQVLALVSMLFVSVRV